MHWADVIFIGERIVSTITSSALIFVSRMLFSHFSVALLIVSLILSWVLACSSIWSSARCFSSFSSSLVGSGLILGGLIWSIRWLVMMASLYSLSSFLISLSVILNIPVL